MFCRIPVEESLRAAWMEALGQTDWTPEPGSVVCSEHILLMDLLGTPTEHPLQLCRICFTTDCKMYSMTSYKTLNEAYKTVTGVMTAEEEHLPRYLCAQCAGRLMNCARFRRRSLRAHSMLLDIVSTHGQINLDLIRSELQNYNTLSSDPADNSNGEHFEFDMKDSDDVIKQTDARVDESPEDVKFTVDQNHIYGKDGTIHVAIDEFKTENEGLNNIGESHLEDIICDSFVENSGITNFTVKMENSEVVDKESSSDEQTASHMASTADLEVEVDEQQTPEADGPSTDDTLRCDICHYQTDSDIHLLEHLKAHAASNNVRQKRNPQIHQLKHSHEKSYTCDVCKKVFRVKGTLKNHISIHSTEKPYSCDVCKKVFREKGILKTHMLIHLNLKPYSCDVCKEVFRCRGNLRIHQLIHTNEKPYSCNVCSKTFRQNSNLKKHLLKHSNFKPYSCDVCNKEFRWKNDLKRHQLIHSNMKPYSCVVCNKFFRRKGDLRSHQLNHSYEKPYSCDVCNKVFRTKGHLKSHKLIHSNDKPYSCVVCNMSFRRKGELRSHQLKHSNEKPYSCDVCKKMFTEKGNLKKHLIIHLDVKPYFCEVCKKMFSERQTLKRHQLIHSNEKPYSCDVCKKMFRDKGHLKIHMLIHSNEKPHSCNVCNKVFRHKSSLKNHQLIHSKEKQSA